jgi:hypothetical protein
MLIYITLFFQMIVMTVEGEKLVPSFQNRLNFPNPEPDQNITVISHNHYKTKLHKIIFSQFK